MAALLNKVKLGIFSILSPLILLLPISLVVQSYAPNMHRLSIELFLTSMLFVTLGFVLFRILVGFFIKEKNMATMVSACLFVGFLMTGFVNIYIAIAWCLLWTVLSVVIFYRRKFVEPLKFGIYFLIANAFVPLFLHLNLIPDVPKRNDLRNKFSSGFAEVKVSNTSTAKRDVYYIVLDRYGRNDQLKSVYGFDNSKFTTQLRNEGFLVADNAYSNYQRTAHSLTSSMNLSYLPGNIDEPIFDWLPLYRKLRNSEIFSIFKKLDYSIHFMGSWWEVTRTNSSADVDFNFRAWPELLRLLYEKSIIGQLAIASENTAADPRQIQCQRAKMKFAELQRLAGQYSAEEPKFVFAHILVPHPPFVIDQNGNCLSVAEAESRTREQNYSEQIIYANKELLKFIKAAKSRDGSKPIIILQADEGPWPKAFIRDEIKYLGRDVTSVDWSNTSAEHLREKMGILNAIYFPDKSNIQFGEDSSPVNNFRLVLNEYFGTNLPLLEDRAFVFPTNADLYRFQDVTDKLSQ